MVQISKGTVIEMKFQKGLLNIYLSIEEVRDPGSVVRRNQFARAQKRENRISFFEKST